MLGSRIRNWDGRSRAIRDKKFPQSVRKDLIDLQLSPNDFFFENGKQLLLEKWRKNVEMLDRLNGFFSEWSIGWHEGYLIKSPSQNNGLESYIGVALYLYLKN